jgi:hypothetical protein
MTCLLHALCRGQPQGSEHDSRLLAGWGLRHWHGNILCSVEFSFSDWDSMQASQQDGDITTENVTVGIVGADQAFTVLEGATLQPFVSQLDSDQPADAPAVAPADDGAAPMES